MKLTPKMLASIYLMLRTLKPFSGWHLPEISLIEFKVTNELDAMGTYFYCDLTERHIITISKAKNGHLSTVIRTLAHEMIHCKRWNTSKWDKHDDTFRRYAAQIANELGFDPLEL
jgi:hypothetical protein